jgi:two-component system, NtrC family, nitrogen regulation response regulator GlnG
VSRILVVDDEEAVCWALQRALTAEGHKVVTAASAEAAFAQVAKQTPNAILLDVRLPGMDGLDALGKLRNMSNDAPVIVMTAFGNLDTAVRAVEGGAFDYLAKPFDLDQALETVARALSRRQVSPTAAEPEKAPKTTDEMVGSGSAMQNVFKRIALVAPRDACVLITGESGTGKELVARAIHRFSTRKDKPFVPVHVAALNPSLVESELFGHVRGAFTGAVQPREGLLTLAQGGTLFLDEIAEIPPAVQVKLLRVLEQNEMMPVGGNEPQRLDLRILAATHQDLAKKVADGSFRGDLFFRLNVFQIHLPPLRQRREDIALLAEHFLRRLEPKALPLLPETLQYLAMQPWVGNVREMRNAIEHAVIVAHGGALLPEHFPVGPTLTGNTPDDQLQRAVLNWVIDRVRAAGSETPQDLYEKILAAIEPPMLEELMRRLQGNRWVAAQWLGLNRATVRKKLTKYGLEHLGTSGPDDPP